ncbi:MAG: hypothetical protein A2Y62_14285 [Candidatus Fischerbacteria bacterium RBG_13_37_8]|uniref:Uncharacterized protein n=1 Tax=Candidatus Fischerbacteria bacterium RBG_13_37_8 TaxID=1817863 RepID=A0A1F5VHJ4_9BACT|nr:MAG: hypothetical protein A2Y62_14285 [Candidatus Fischerbacteria bacterium RBG_13_37_8]
MVKYLRNGNANLEIYGIKNPIGDKTMESKKKETKSNIPDYIASSPIENGEKTYWQNIGSAWKTQKGINIVLNALPINNKICLFENTKEE